MAETPKGKGLGKKVGPFPLWGWAVAAAGAVGVAYYLNKKKKAAQSAKPTTQATMSAYPGTPAVGTLASQVPQFVNQTYTNPTPPAVTQTVTTTNNPPPVPPPPHKGGDDDDRGRTGGWKGQHSNGQGSHPGKKIGGPGSQNHPAPLPTPKPTPTPKPKPGVPIRRSPLPVPPRGV
jgi:hypothetical protein